MRAYPPRSRQDRGEELIGTLLDLAGPGKRLPAPRDIADIVRGGLAARWRQHPPFMRWLSYRFADQALPPRSRAWAQDDLLGRWYPLRRAFPWAAAYLLLAIAIPVPGTWWFWPLVGASAVTGDLAWSRWRRRRMLRKHGYCPDGSPASSARSLPVSGTGQMSSDRVGHGLFAVADVRAGRRHVSTFLGYALGLSVASLNFPASS